MKAVAIVVGVLLLIAPIATAAKSRHLVRQSGPSDCGPAALATLLGYLGVEAREGEIRQLSDYNAEQGTTLLGLREAAEAKGCSAASAGMDFAALVEQLRVYPAPLIVLTRNPEPHFSVLLGVDGDLVFLADPAIGNFAIRRRAFLKRFYAPGAHEGAVLVAVSPDHHIAVDQVQQVVGYLRANLRRLRESGPALR